MNTIDRRLFLKQLGISIDQELKNYFQGRAATRTPFGSLEFGVGVTDRADPWTRMSYAGPNQPVAPISDPYQMYRKLYGQLEDKETLRSVLDDVGDDLKQVSRLISPEDRAILEQHTTLVRQMETQLAQADHRSLTLPPPNLESGVKDQNDNVPKLSRMQIDLLVNSFVNDMARVATQWSRLFHGPFTPVRQGRPQPALPHPRPCGGPSTRDLRQTRALRRRTARFLASFAPSRELDFPLPGLTAPRLQRRSAECCFSQRSAASKSGQTRATSRQYRSEWFISRR